MKPGPTRPKAIPKPTKSSEISSDRYKKAVNDTKIPIVQQKEQAYALTFELEETEAGAKTEQKGMARLKALIEQSKDQRRAARFAKEEEAVQREKEQNKLDKQAPKDETVLVLEFEFPSPPHSHSSSSIELPNSLPRSSGSSLNVEDINSDDIEIAEAPKSITTQFKMRASSAPVPIGGASFSRRKDEVEVFIGCPNSVAKQKRASDIGKQLLNEVARHSSSDDEEVDELVEKGRKLSIK